MQIFENRDQKCNLTHVLGCILVHLQEFIEKCGVKCSQVRIYTHVFCLFCYKKMKAQAWKHESQPAYHKFTLKNLRVFLENAGLNPCFQPGYLISPILRNKCCHNSHSSSSSSSNLHFTHSTHILDKISFFIIFVARNQHPNIPWPS